jgi:hypothetical protein
LPRLPNGIHHEWSYLNPGGTLETLYLFTPDRESFYQNLGWQVLSKEEYRGAWVTVMCCCLHGEQQ